VMYVGRLETMRNSYKMLVGKPEGKRPFRLRRRSWSDSIEITRNYAKFVCVCT
jgi:hypothetical protein